MAKATPREAEEKQMQSFKRRYMCVALVLAAVMLVFGLTACEPNDSDMDYSDSDSVDESEYSDDSEEDPSSLSDERMTAERAEAIYVAFADNSYEDYLELGQEAWDAKTAEERTAMYKEFCVIAEQIGLKVSRNESEWLESMDWNIEMYNLFLCALVSLDLDNDTQIKYLQSVYSYGKGVHDGKFEPLDENILAVADNLRVEYNLGTYLLCVGGDHSIEQITYEWTTQEESFAASGSVKVVVTDDTFADTSVSYSINGQNGVFETAKFGTTDFLPIFKGIGAIDENNAFLAEQIDICAVNVFDAEILYVLSQEDIGLTTIAVVVYDDSRGEYVWDGQTYLTHDRCCFNKDGEFCYVDMEGDLWNLTETYAGGDE